MVTFTEKRNSKTANYTRNMYTVKKATGLRLLPYAILAGLTVLIGLVGPLVSEYLVLRIPNLLH